MRFNLYAVLLAVITVLLAACVQSAPFEPPRVETTEVYLTVIGIPTSTTVSCTEEVIADRERHIKILREVRQRYQDRLMAVSGVIGTGVGIVYEEGEPIDEIGIIIFADAKLPPDQVDLERVIPSELEGCTVDVQPASPFPAVSGED